MVTVNFPEATFRFGSYPDIDAGETIHGVICSSCQKLAPLFRAAAAVSFAGPAAKISAACPYCAHENIFGVADLRPGIMPDDIPYGGYIGEVAASKHYFEKLGTALPQAIPTLSLDSLKHRPTAMQMLAHCICAWTEVESEQASLLTTLIGSHKSDAVAAVYLSIKRGSTQADALGAAAQTVLSKDNYRLFEALNVVSKMVGDGRNMLAHSHFSAIPAEPYGLISVDTSKYERYTTKLRSFSDKEKITERNNIFRLHRLSNLARLQIDIEEIRRNINNFNVYLSTENKNYGTSLRQSLIASTHIREALKELDARDQNRKQSRRKGGPKARKRSA